MSGKPKQRKAFSLSCKGVDRDKEYAVLDDAVKVMVNFSLDETLQAIYSQVHCNYLGEDSVCTAGDGGYCPYVFTALPPLGKKPPEIEDDFKSGGTGHPSEYVNPFHPDGGYFMKHAPIGEENNLESRVGSRPRVQLESLPNTCVSFRSKGEFDLLMMVYECAGWKWHNGEFPTDHGAVDYTADLLVDAFVDGFHGEWHFGYGTSASLAFNVISPDKFYVKQDLNASLLRQVYTHFAKKDLPDEILSLKRTIVEAANQVQQRRLREEQERGDIHSDIDDLPF